MKIKEIFIETDLTGSQANCFKMILLSILTFLLFAPVLYQLIHLWSNSDDYSHGFFVIPIALFMVWQKRQHILNLPKKPLWAGFPIFIIGIIIYYICFVIRFHTLMNLSMILIILALFLFISGWQITRAVFFSVLFLLFMFPIPSAYYILITNPLKLMITNISAAIIGFMGIPVFQEGNLLFFTNTNLEVAEACSGIRSLYSYMMIGCLFAMLSKQISKKVILILSTLPLAILVNIIRVTGTGILASYYGPKVAQGFFHEFTGFFLFAIGLIFLFLEFYFLDGKKNKEIKCC